MVALNTRGWNLAFTFVPSDAIFVSLILPTATSRVSRTAVLGIERGLLCGTGKPSAGTAISPMSSSERETGHTPAIAAVTNGVRRAVSR